MEEQRKSENALVPALRFEGFSDPWEQRKVGDYLVESRERGSSGDVAKKLTVKLWGKGVTEKAEISGSAHTQYCVRHAGQFIYSKLDFLNAAFGVIPDNLDEYESTADLPAFDVSNLDARFLLLKATQRSFYLRYGTIADGSRKAKRIHSEAFLAMPLFVPDYIEQTRIANLFARLDLLIALHQRKHEKLKTVKQSLLEKMFPKEGEDVPEIRFEGFTDPWEQRRLGEISESYSGGTPSVGNESYYGGDIPFIRSAEISSDSTELRLTEKGLDNSSAALVESGCVLYALYGATSGEVAISRIRGAINQAILAIVPSKNNNAEFIAAWLRREKPKILDTYLQGGQGNLSGAIVKDLTLALPSGEEQSRIGALFQKLDSLIALHQRERAGV